MFYGLELFGWKWVAHKNIAYEFMQLIHDSSAASTFERKEESQEQVLMKMDQCIEWTSERMFRD